MQEALGEQRRLVRGAGDLAAQAVELVAVAAEAEAVELRVDLGGGELVLRRHDDDAERLRVAEGADVLADPRHQAALGRELARDVGAERDRQLVQQAGIVVAGRGGGEPERRRGVGAAAAHAGGDGHALGDREPERRAVPAGRGAEGVQRAGGEVLAVDARADDVVAAALGGLEEELVGQRERLDERDERVVAVAARAADEEAHVDLRRREAAERLHRVGSSAGPAAVCSAAPAHATRPARAARRARRPGGRSPRAPHGRGRGSPARRPGASESERASALRRCAKPCWTSARSAGSGAGPRRVSPTRTESTFGTGWKTVRDTGRSTRTSQASWASTDGTP